METTLAAYLRRRVGLSADYRSLMRAVVRDFCVFLGYAPRPETTTADMMADWLAHLVSAGLSPATVNGSRRRLLSVIKSAASAHAAELAAMVPRLPEPDDPPEAWTVEEVGELLWTARHWPGRIDGLPAGAWWDSLFAVTYWTGCRIGALRQTTPDDYCLATGWLTVRGCRQKNRRGQRFRLPDHCRSKIEAIYSIDRPLLWPWPYCRRWFFTIARRIIERAGLSCPKTGRQLFHRLRRTNLSYCWAADPALAQRQAGHASGELTRRRYVDPRIAGLATAADILPTPAY
jgi:integrase